MPTSRSVPRAALAAAMVTGALLPATAAALPTPVWQTPEAVSAAGGATGQGVGGAMAPNGAVLAGWSVISGGRNQMHVAYRPAHGNFGPPTLISDPNRDARLPVAKGEANGDTTVVWTSHDNGSDERAVFATLNATTGEWTAETRLGDPADLSFDPVLTTSPAGLVAAWVTGNSNHAVQLATRPTGSSSWNAPITVTDGTADPSAKRPQVIVAPNGDITVLWFSGTPVVARTATLPAGSTTFGPPTTLALGAGGDDGGMGWLTAASDSSLTAAWVEAQSSVGHVYSARRTAAGTWDPAILHSSNAAVIPAALTTSDDTTVLTWLDTSTFESFSTSRAAGAPTWSPLTGLAPGGGEIGITTQPVIAPDDRIYGFGAIGGSFMSASPQALVRDPSNGLWSVAQAFPGETVDFLQGGGAASDGKNNFGMVWIRTDHTVAAVTADGGVPQLGTVTVPSSATAGDPVLVSAEPSDSFSSVTTTWTSGDGQTRTGATASFSYDEAGTYTVTARVVDAAGHSTSTTRSITVAARPVAPPTATPTPPTVDGPIVEALLAGRTVTLNVRVRLPAGRSCSGKATGTTRFGTTSYRTSLKLVSIGGVCRATGTIRLKRAPSTRTRLRVTVSARGIKARTLTTRRG